MYDLLINLSNAKMSIRKAKKEEEEMISQIVMLWDLFKPMETKIRQKTKHKEKRFLQHGKVS